MSKPGTDVNLINVPVPRSTPVDTGVFFAVGTSDMGPLAPTLIQSMNDFTRIFGQRQSYSVLYDTLDSFFQEGGAQAYIGRVVGPAAVAATRNLLDAGAAISLVATAVGPGASYNSVYVGVVAGQAGGSFQIQVAYPNAATIVEQSGDLLTQADAINWAKQSNYIRLSLGASANNPAVVAPTALAGGNDDRLNAVDLQWRNALALFTPDLGPGQVAQCGRTTDQAHIDTLAHAAANNRFALLDAPDTATAATLNTAAVNARLNGQYGMLLAPWVVIPGVVGGTVRTVPPCGIVAGMMNRSDVQTGSPNIPAAANQGQSLIAVGLSQVAWDDPTRTTLNNNGVSVFRVIQGAVQLYGYRTLADPVALPQWIFANNARLTMAIVARVRAVMNNYVFAQIDGRGTTISALNGDITSILIDYYNKGSLYGVTPDLAFSVNTGPAVNTPTTIANGEIHAQLNLHESPEAEWVQVNVAKVPLTTAV